MGEFTVQGGDVDIFKLVVNNNGELVYKPLGNHCQVGRIFTKKDSECLIKFLEKHYKDEYSINELSHYRVENEFEIKNSQNEVVMLITGNNKIPRDILHKIAIESRDRFNKYHRSTKKICD